MRRLLPLLTVVAALAAAGSAQASPVLPLNVSTSPLVLRDLTAAREYFQAALPDVAPVACRDVTVLVEKMRNAVLAGATVAASGVWAETELDSCEIDVSPDLWGFLTLPGYGPNIDVEVQTARNAFDDVPAHGRWAVAYGCAVLTHEYGHTFGLDSEPFGIGMPIMQEGNRLDVPPCNLLAYGWRHISHKDRLWLIGAGERGR